MAEHACPRCLQPADTDPFYGPCAPCREELNVIAANQGQMVKEALERHEAEARSQERYCCPRCDGF